MKRNGNYDKSLSTRAPQELRNRVERAARAEKRSIANMILILLDEALTRREKTNHKVGKK